MPPKHEPARSGASQPPPPTATPLLTHSAAAQENSWHRDWMEQTENAYEWWYFDSVSDDGEWSLVVIFLLGSPFSPYSRACELNQNPNPLDYNGVFVALHYRGRLLHYQYARYSPEKIAASVVGSPSPLDIQFGPNGWSGVPAGNDFVITLDEENANRRRMTARLAFSDLDLRGGAVSESLSVLSEPGHNWLPVIVGGRARCVIELHAPAETRQPERIEFRGSAYHDHNWGTLPFNASIQRWLWGARRFRSRLRGRFVSDYSRTAASAATNFASHQETGRTGARTPQRCCRCPGQPERPKWVWRRLSPRDYGAVRGRSAGLAVRQKPGIDALLYEVRDERGLERERSA